METVKTTERCSNSYHSHSIIAPSLPPPCEIILGSTLLLRTAQCSSVFSRLGKYVVFLVPMINGPIHSGLPSFGYCQ